MDTEKPEAENKLDYLVTQKRTANKNPAKYSRFIKSLRVLLPLLAIGIMTLLFSWSTFQNPNIAPINTPIQEETPRSEAISKNELLSPRFESLDNNGQPFVITAARALQSTDEEGLMILENALGDLSMKDGHWLAVKSDQAAYTEASQRLLLRNDVQLFYDNGYTMRTQLLDINMNTSSAHTDTPVEISGPAGLIDAQGLKATGENEYLVFLGPARLTLFQNDTGFDLQRTMP